MNTLQFIEKRKYDKIITQGSTAQGIKATEVSQDMVPRTGEDPGNQQSRSFDHWPYRAGPTGLSSSGGTETCQLQTITSQLIKGRWAGVGTGPPGKAHTDWGSDVAVQCQGPVQELIQEHCHPRLAARPPEPRGDLGDGRARKKFSPFSRELEEK